MPGEIDLPLPDPGQPEARPLHVLPGRARTPGVRHRSAAGDPARPARSDRGGTAGHPAGGLDARRRAAARDVADLLPGRDRRRRSGRLCPGRAGRPVHRGDPHRPRDRRRDRLRRPRRGPAAAPARTPIPTLTPSGTSAWRAISRRIASIRSRAPTELALHAQGIAWKLQGANPLATRVRGGLAEPARPGAGRDGGAAGAALDPRCCAKASSCSIRIPNRWARSASSIRRCSGATSASGS